MTRALVHGARLAAPGAPEIIPRFDGLWSKCVAIIQLRFVELFCHRACLIARASHLITGTAALFPIMR